MYHFGLHFVPWVKLGKGNGGNWLLALGKHMGKYRGDDKRGEDGTLEPEDGWNLEVSLIFFFYESSGFDFGGI